MSSNQTSTITPDIGEKIKLIFTTLIDLVIYGVNQMKKEPKNAKSAAEEKTPTEGVRPPADESEADVKKDKPIYYTYTPDKASSTTTAAENGNELIIPPMKTGEKINVSTSSLQVNV